MMEGFVWLIVYPPVAAACIAYGMVKRAFGRYR